MRMWTRVWRRRLATAFATALGARAGVGQPPARPAASTPPLPATTLAGVVETEDDVPVYGARVTVRTAGTGGTPRTAVTADGGSFRFADVTRGWAELVVRRLGFRPETLTVEVPQPSGGRVVVPLHRVSQVLSPVVVRATVARGPFAAFERRRAAGFGRFVTRLDIERRRPQRTSDLLRTVPGLAVERNDVGAALPRFRNASVGFSGAPCYPVFWIDGSPLGPALDVDGINPGAIEGIELYSGIATVPPALRTVSAPGTCGVIAIWTRQGEPRARRRPAPDDAEAVDALVTAGRAFTADQVDVPALPVPGGEPAPVYPDSLRSARASGRVVVEFVVDESGALEEETLGVVSATHDAFADAVRAALPGVRFTPAERRGRRVRQVVHLPVLFDPDIGAHVAVPVAAPGAAPARASGAADSRVPPGR